MTSPIFIIGHPRSGTTFLHRFIVQNVPGVAAKTLRDMLALAPLLSWATAVRALGSLAPLDWLYHPDIHKTGLAEVETDDVAFALACKGGYLHWLYHGCRAHRCLTGAALEQEFVHQRARVLACWQTLYQRELSLDHVRIVSKSSALVFHIEALLQRFPDARIILMVRDPLQVVPSTLSLLHSVLRHVTWYRQRQWDAYYGRVYAAIRCYYQMVQTLTTDARMRARLFVLRYEQWLPSFADHFMQVCRYCGIELNAQSRTQVALQDHAQRTWRSPHCYRASDFGISETRIQQDIPYDRTAG